MYGGGLQLSNVSIDKIYNGCGSTVVRPKLQSAFYYITTIYPILVLYPNCELIRPYTANSLLLLNGKP